MPAVGAIGVIAEVVSVIIDLGKVIWAGAALTFSKEPFRTVSSLTTIEFTYENGQQVANFVQDRQVAFVREGTLPPFIFATDGTEHIDQLLIDDASKPFEIKQETGHPDRIILTDPRTYKRNDQVSMALVARSTNGFTKPQESFSLEVIRWVGRSRTAIIFPDNKKPTSFGAFYRNKEDKPETKRHAGREACSLKRTTCSRWVLLWERTNALPGRTYTLEWEWPT